MVNKRKMNLLSKFSKKESQNKNNIEISTGEDLIAYNKNYEWNFEGYKNEAKNYLEKMIASRDLGLKNQVILNAREITKTMFKDYCEANSLEAEEMDLRPINENYDTGLYTMKNSFKSWYLHSLNTKSIRFPAQVINALETIKEFPQAFIENIGILESMGQKTSKINDYRLSNEKPSYTTLIPKPDPILSVKVADQWYSTLKWE